MTHTPGPWRISTENGVSINAAAKDSRTGHEFTKTVVVVRGQNSLRETEANISLICAAPDLLAALESVLVGFEDTMDRYGPDAGYAAAARAAIEKAKGQQP